MLNYKGLRAVREHLTVSDVQVDRQIDSLLEQRMKTLPVEGRPAQADDEVVLDYAGEIDGEFFEGGTAENQSLVLGSGMFIPGFEEQLIGRRPGEDVDVRVTFPEQYHAANLAGREAVFHCKLKAIQLKRKYAADDEFAREVGGCETFEAFRASVRAALQAYADQQAEAELKDQLLNQLCEGAPRDIPQPQLDRALDLEMRALEAQLARQGLNLDLYCSFMNTTKEKLREDRLPHARRSVERQLAVAEIAQLENIEADEAGVAAKLEEICRENGMTIAQLQPHINEAFQAAVEQSVVTDKVLDLILAHAEIEQIEKKADA